VAQSLLLSSIVPRLAKQTMLEHDARADLTAGITPRPPWELSLRGSIYRVSFELYGRDYDLSTREVEREMAILVAARIYTETLTAIRMTPARLSFSPEPKHRPLVNQNGAAKYLGLSLSTFRRRVLEHVPRIMLPGASTPMFDPKDLDEWVVSRRCAPIAEVMERVRRTERGR